MIIFNRTVFGCLFCLLPGIECSWTYKNPSTWTREFPKCRGKRQSPINVVKSATEYSEPLVNSLNFSNYDSAKSGDFLVSNNGHTLQINTSPFQPSITLKGEGDFILAQFHFHWGSDDNKGSEHQINGESYPAELHLVHYNNKYSSLKEAMNKSDGLAVLGVMIKKGTENDAFKHFLDFTRYNITHKGTNSSIKAFPIRDLLPSKIFAFHRYNGSLTTPTCDETVTWTLFDQAVEISEKQLAEFRRLKGNGSEIMDNFRPLQNLNGRKVLTTIKKECDSGGWVKASTFNVSSFVLLSVVFL